MALLNETAAAINSVTTPRVNAKLNLEFAYDHSKQTTVLQESSSNPPLKVVRAFQTADGAALIHLHNVSGGLLGDDRLAMSVQLSENAKVQITTTGATRIYRARESASAATQKTEIALAENAFLEYLPDPIIPYAAARYAQQTTIHLAKNAGLFWWEILAPGREAHGELFAYDSVEMKTDIIAEGQKIARERIQLDPKKYPLDSPARLGPYRYWATFYICKPGVDPAEWQALENKLREAASEFPTPNETRWGISTLPAHGAVCRCLSMRGRDALQGLHQLWRVAKQSLYNAEAIPPRKVN
jgi:urease accessory protein